MRKFDLEEALAGHAVMTRDGRKITGVREVNRTCMTHRDAEDMCDNSTFIQGLVATVHNTQGLHEYRFYHDGGAHKYGGVNGCDLFMDDRCGGLGGMIFPQEVRDSVALSFKSKIVGEFV
jgi:hypothetical protein